MGSSESKQAESRMQRAALSNVEFPVQFNIYYKGISGLKFILGEDESKSSKLVSLSCGWASDLILYNGSTTDADPIAMVRNASKLGHRDIIELPATKPGQQPIREELRSHCNGWSLAYAFVAPVSEGLLPGKFEWRSSHSDEVKNLGESSFGWKLVRMGDGDDEIVAVAANAKMSRFWGKAGAFRFVGRGALGEFGRAWAVMAVASFMRVLQKKMEDTSAAAAS